MRKVLLALGSVGFILASCGGGGGGSTNTGSVSLYFTDDASIYMFKNILSKNLLW